MLENAATDYEQGQALKRLTAFLRGGMGSVYGDTTFSVPAGVQLSQQEFNDLLRQKAFEIAKQVKSLLQAYLSLDPYNIQELLYPQHQAFLKDRTIPLANEPEILQNISKNLGFPRLAAPEEKPEILVAQFIWSMMLLILAVMALGYAVPKIIDFLTRGYFIDSNPVVVLVIAGVGIILVRAYFKVLFFMYKVATVDIEKIKVLYRQLFTSGEIHTGKVTKVFPDFQKGLEIHYSIDVKDKEGIVGSYTFTAGATDFGHRYSTQVCVLYLNEQINILL